MFKTILVPTDGSENAKKAVALASDLAAKYRARMILLHVVADYDLPESAVRFAEVENVPEAKTTQHVEPILVGPPHVVVDSPVGARAQVKRHEVMHGLARNILDAAAGRAREHGVQALEAVTSRGDPATQILEVARRERADSIVMGSRGLSDFQGAFIGSVSHKVCHLADCTCVTVC